MLSAGQPACNAGAAASASTASQTTEIDGRLFYRHLLLPAECYSECLLVQGFSAEIYHSLAKGLPEAPLIETIRANLSYKPEFFGRTVRLEVEQAEREENVETTCNTICNTFPVHEDSYRFDE